ncbi:MAG: WecB/TagA/CpsF family glycosyltransferase, partial [Bacteroidales bacterium]|nr:WecB/TagA/CpsF family glycosyltransferase [Bacteroidales bacterium]
SMQIIAEINDFKPDVLFISMTAPKQEKWLYKYRGQLQGVKMAASIGGVFEFYAGTLKRAPKWAIKMHIEWLVRLIKEPQRMWKRNFVSTPKFLHWVWKHRKEC